MLCFTEACSSLKGKDNFVKKNHVHNDIEIIYVQSGQGTLLKNSATYSFRPQMLFMIDARNAHIVNPRSEDCSDYIRSKIVMDADSFERFCHELGLAKLAQRLLEAAPVTVGDPMRICRVFDAVTALCRDGKEEKRGFAHQHIIGLMEWLNGQIGQEPSAERSETVQRILNVIEDKGGLTNLTEISRTLYLDKYYLCHLFREKTGMTLSAYLSEKIYEKARTLLTSTAESIETIAFSCGFSSASAFSRFFKARGGIAPSEFRRKNR